MLKDVPRSFSRAFKLKAVERLEAGESSTDLSRDLTVKRTILYRWRDAFPAGGALALRPKRGRRRRHGTWPRPGVRSRPWSARPASSR